MKSTTHKLKELANIIWPKVLYVMDLLAQMIKLLGLVFYGTFLSFLSVLLCWAAIGELKASSLPKFVDHHNLGAFLSDFFLVLLVLNIMYVLWVLACAHNTRSSTKGGMGKTRSDRIAIATFWPLIASATEVFIFRLLWIHFQIPAKVGAPFSIDPLVDLEDLGIVMLIVGWLNWTKSNSVMWVARTVGMSLAPVVGVKADGSLLLADGGSIPFDDPKSWPTKGIRRSKVACVVTRRLKIKGADRVVDVLITENGDSYYSPPLSPPSRRWRKTKET